MSIDLISRPVQGYKVSRMSRSLHVPKNTKPDDPLQVQVEPVVPIKENKIIQILEAQARQKVYGFSWTKHRWWREFFAWFYIVPGIGPI